MFFQSSEGTSLIIMNMNIVANKLYEVNWKVLSKINFAHINILAHRAAGLIDAICMLYETNETFVRNFSLPLNNHWKAISYSARVDIRWLRLDYCVATLSRAVSHKSRLSQTAKSLRGCVCTGCVRRWSNFCVRTLRPEIAQGAIVVRHVEGNDIVLRCSLHPFRALDNENRKN